MFRLGVASKANSSGGPSTSLSRLQTRMRSTPSGHFLCRRSCRHARQRNFTHGCMSQLLGLASKMLLLGRHAQREPCCALLPSQILERGALTLVDFDKAPEGIPKFIGQRDEGLAGVAVAIRNQRDRCAARRLTNANHIERTEHHALRFEPTGFRAASIGTVRTLAYDALQA